MPPVPPVPTTIEKMTHDTEMLDPLPEPEPTRLPDPQPRPTAQKKEEEGDKDTTETSRREASPKSPPPHSLPIRVMNIKTVEGETI